VVNEPLTVDSEPLGPVFDSVGKPVADDLAVDVEVGGDAS
jgi:hypothetical protein